MLLLTFCFLSLLIQGISADGEREEMAIIKVKESRKLKHLGSQHPDIKELSDTIILC